MALWAGEQDVGEEKGMAVMKEGGGSGTQCLLFTLHDSVNLRFWNCDMMLGLSPSPPGLGRESACMRVFS